MPGSFELITIDGQLRTGLILELRSTLTWLNDEPLDEDPLEIQVRRDEILTLRNLDESYQHPLPEPLILLNNDQQIHATIESSSDTDLRIISPLLGRLDWPLESVVGVLLNSARDSENTSKRGLLNRLSEIRQRDDPGTIAWLRNNDQARGTFNQLNRQALILQAGGESRTYSRRILLGFAMDPSLIDDRPVPVPCDELHLVEGTRILVTDLEVRGDRVRGTLLNGQALSELDLDEVATIIPKTATTVPLQTRPVLAQEESPYLGPPQPSQTDRSIDGDVLMLQGRIYDRGYGMTSQSRVVFALEPTDRRFLGRVGLNDRAGELADVNIRVYRDRELAWEAQSVRAGSQPRRVNVELKNHRFLILEVDYGARGSIRDWVDWVELYLVKAPD